MKKLLLLSLVALFMIGCENENESNNTPSISGLVLTESDYVSGWYGILDTTSDTYSKGLVIDSDSRIAVGGSDLYVLERSTANLLKLDGEGQVVYQSHIADNYNPQQMAYISSTKAYLCGLGSQWLYEVNPTNGAIVDSVDLSGFNHSNTIPMANGVVAVNGTIYVGLQRLASDWSVTTNSQIAVIDMATNTITDTIKCEGMNFAQFTVDGEAIYVLNSGDAYGTKEGATYEKISTTDNSIVTLSEALLAGSPVTAMTQKSGNQFYVTSYVGWGTVPVDQVDVTTGVSSWTLAGVENAFGGLAYDAVQQKLYIGENGTNYGIAIYNEVLDTLINVTTTLKPSSIALK